jgi:cytochrome d ubiquinol oxidase subunit II
VTDPTLVVLAVLALLAGLSMYAVFAGADFGGGIWDLLSFGERKSEQRSAIARAMGPVW